MFKQLRGNQTQQGSRALDLARVNFPSLGFPVPFLDVSIYSMFLGSWFKGHQLGGERMSYTDLGLAVKISATAELCGSKVRFIDMSSQPLSISSFSGKL